MRTFTFLPLFLLAALMSASLPVHAQTSVDGDVSVSSDDVSLTVDGSADTDGSGDAPVSPTDDTVVSTDGNASTGGPLSLTQEQAVAASLDAESAEMSASAVANSDDLSRYATAAMKRDTRLMAIDATSDHVSVEYRADARLLGFIPSGLTAEVHVDRDGTVEVSYPWYRFLFALDHKVEEAELQESLSGVLASNATFGFDAMATATLIDRIHAALSGTAATDFAADGSETTIDSTTDTASDTPVDEADSSASTTLEGEAGN